MILGLLRLLRRVIDDIRLIAAIEEGDRCG
jgi:hypothetical protein